MQHEKFRTRLASLICSLLELQPRLHVIEAVEKGFLPILPAFVPFTTRQDLDEVQRRFASGAVRTKDLSGAAWLLLLDAVLWMAFAFEKPKESRFNELADATRSSQEARLRFAHCIRDLAYGKAHRENDLVDMVKKPDSEMRRLLADICWIGEKKRCEKYTVHSHDSAHRRSKTRHTLVTGEVVLVSRLRAALERLNPALPPEAITAAVDELTRDRSAMSLEAANHEVYRLLKEGIPVSVAEKDSTPGHTSSGLRQPSPQRGEGKGGQTTVRVQVIDWEQPANNDFLLVS